jgi:predicted GNAT superfamily acetyltransferase
VTDGITIRDLASHDDYAACVALQRETWGRNFNDTVPASILLVSQKLGGVAAGAFDAAGTLIGFVYGMTGVENGRIVHWSDMLAVRPDAQNSGIGRRLKEYQRQAVAAVGGEVIYWTFDPLVARNAYLNFTVFGVRVIEYVRNMYGTNTGSDLHRGIGTDRLIVAWPVQDADLRARRKEIARAVGNPATQILVEVPPDIGSLLQTNPDRALQWRASSRAGIESALAAGHRIDGVRIEGGRVFYIFTKPEAQRGGATRRSGKPKPPRRRRK